MFYITFNNETMIQEITRKLNRPKVSTDVSLFIVTSKRLNKKQFLDSFELFRGFLWELWLEPRIKWLHYNLFFSPLFLSSIICRFSLQ